MHESERQTLLKTKSEHDCRQMSDNGHYVFIVLVFNCNLGWILR